MLQTLAHQEDIHRTVILALASHVKLDITVLCLIPICLQPVPSKQVVHQEHICHIQVLLLSATVWNVRLGHTLQTIIIQPVQNALMGHIVTLKECRKVHNVLQERISLMKVRHQFTIVWHVLLEHYIHCLEDTNAIYVLMDIYVTIPLRHQYQYQIHHHQVILYLPKFYRLQ